MKSLPGLEIYDTVSKNGFDLCQITYEQVCKVAGKHQAMVDTICSKER